jgi:hypothetical protein
MVEETYDVEFDEINGSQGALENLDDVGDECNALNLGVEFFLLFTHQIQALLSFLFPFRSFFPISKQYSDWRPYRV